MSPRETFAGCFSASDRCCFGCCFIKPGAIAVCVWLIIESLAAIIFLWLATYTSKAQLVPVVIGTVFMAGVIVVSVVTIRGIRKNVVWPIVLMIIVLIVEAVGSLCMAVGTAIQAPGSEVDDAKRSRLISRVIASICYMLNYLWFIYIMHKARQFILSLKTAAGDSGKDPTMELQKYGRRASCQLPPESKVEYPIKFVYAPTAPVLGPPAPERCGSVQWELPSDAEMRRLREEAAKAGHQPSKAKIKKAKPSRTSIVLPKVAEEPHLDGPPKDASPA